MERLIMKNIRFRKYDHLNSGFAYSHRLDGGSTTTFDFDMTYNSKNWIGSHRHQLMQYTGVTDRTGRPIFEGDIVSIENGTHQKMCVYFDHGKFVPVYKYQSRELQIVGNVFDEE
ncbi:hypothetical protein CBG01_05580 [Limosilactobacillus reuteri]|uniref:Uncharacterized protein n=2 Tax=Limosilactobacillus reuteri TaxID=1598 RepID=A0A256VJ41_LIMRT|nr:hypothetical protein DL317_10390 [Limosilactobacillus reuteri]OYS59699.1 hypothetical protein CBF88_05285 [Limosilactobacillus reuteri]OYS61290.1 hypothetical protein CBF91_05910 [Limosilactobacillus reuteri]OYS64461.1 hypothetical protein CBF89_05660 [Limosilactobacillus reuteri]OYS72498.1 hypothetical protein CBG01_05580 [Limosilactobacillus reuteri]